ncbi:MAG: hypothetical protein KatS3mg110_3714 [Pirellulaceae bacterium]|nr:MAG: hypothetical protein KatS3mg110_3714 [Pirellulaceae bacterium]
MAARRRQRWKTFRRQAEGCAGWLATCIASLLLFAVNVTICKAVYEAFAGRWFPESRIQVKQAVLLVAPAVLLFLQWWLWDLAGEWLVNHFFGREQSDERS